MPRKASSTPSTTYQQRWTAEEDLEFLQSMRLAGYGRWTRISSLMGGTRTPLQVKNRARHLLTYEVDSPLTDELRQLAKRDNTVGRRRKESGEEDVYVIERNWTSNPKDEPVDDILLSDEGLTSSFDEVDLSVESASLQSGNDSETLRLEIINCWQRKRPEQLSLEELFELLSEHNMEDITELYYKLEEENVINSMAPRRRRVRDEHGNWVESSGSGRTIDHTFDCKSVESPKLLRKRRPIGHVHDPEFELSEPVSYPVHRPQPFRVNMADWVSVVVEAHSLVSTNEVIGLLGGSFDSDQHTLNISEVFPCAASDSSGIECEMDAVSEMRACEYFAEKNVSIIGWYHSHPSFPPNPSKRDIETQSMYQSMFPHFVGLIIEPCDPAKIQIFRVESQECYSMTFDVYISDKPIVNGLSKMLDTVDVIHSDSGCNRLMRFFPNDSELRRRVEQLRVDVIQ